MSTEKNLQSGLIQGPISVERSLPEELKGVFLFRGMNDCFKGFLDNESHFKDGDAKIVDSVTHWMPIPIPEMPFIPKMVPGFTPIGHGLPKSGLRVIAAAVGLRYFKATLEGGSWFFIDGEIREWQRCPHQVLAWMPIPPTERG